MTSDSVTRRLAAQRAFWLGLGALLSCAALYFLHPSGQGNGAPGVLGFISIGLLAFFAARQIVHGKPLWWFALVVAGAMAWLGPRALSGLMWLNFVEYQIINALLGIEFGRSLMADSVPLCTHFASLVWPELSMAQRRYTHHVTRVWTLFFVAMLCISATLFATLPQKSWAVFADLVTPVLVAALFVAEYAVRCIVLPPDQRLDPGSALRGYRAAQGVLTSAPVSVPAREVASR